MKQLIMAFSGPSNSGKTTLIEKLTRHFMQKGLKVLVIKHDPADKTNFDKEGKDSFKFFQSGAETIILSPTKTILFSHKKRDIFEALKLVEFDLCLIEGLKELDLPRISVFCKEIDTSYFSFSNAIASYEKISYENLVWLDLNDLEQIASFILNNALKGEFDARTR
ncbi:molybdopterin-guanine dinucleotide biosynthesis protein B [Campylobacter upsaliensis]|uniref:molybdopterin-guanine dinucleotide biosynthesis protein B n=1 Tax=Campylobacter felis TaxID=2974565 RepID=UPI00126EE06E|nr:molybdopterin-guanine dinucleotide biosynthesis protein B [Campylobacter felis]EAK0963503.1 molybdopterin-guanine dinucleotide biosynthesis protein B [Campylobacter upsaliensis]MDL0109666.1 molybdopterin-guanine dinucleotide biosynthesis protein B [Campylobacter felis]MDL0114066.1 molybdopterin-guanine dinucleotide biosynthesis protein B [Campylobacter felis]